MFFFIIEKYHAVRLPEFGIYYIGQTPVRGYSCVEQHMLLDYYPISEYILLGMPVLILHHSVLE